MTAITTDYLLTKWFRPVPIKSIQDQYMIDEDWNVFTIGKQIFLTPRIDWYWYIFVRMYVPERQKTKGKNFPIARMVCAVFNGTDGIRWQVNHKNLNKLNNHYSNLEFITPAQNSHHRLNNGWWERKTYQETRRLLDEQQRKFKASAKHAEIMAYLAQ